MIVERVKWKIVLCIAMYNSCAQCDMHTHVSNITGLGLFDFMLCTLTEFGEITQNKGHCSIQGY